MGYANGWHSSDPKDTRIGAMQMAGALEYVADSACSLAPNHRNLPGTGECPHRAEGKAETSAVVSSNRLKPKWSSQRATSTRWRASSDAGTIPKVERYMSPKPKPIFSGVGMAACIHITFGVMYCPMLLPPSGHPGVFHCITSQAQPQNTHRPSSAKVRGKGHDMPRRVGGNSPGLRGVHSTNVRPITAHEAMLVTRCP